MFPVSIVYIAGGVVFFVFSGDFAWWERSDEFRTIATSDMVGGVFRGVGRNDDRAGDVT